MLALVRDRYGSRLARRRARRGADRGGRARAGRARPARGAARQLERTGPALRGVPGGAVSADGLVFTPVRRLGELVRERRLSPGDAGRDVPRAARAPRPPLQRGGDGHAGARARAGPPGRGRDRGRPLPRPAARHPVRGQGSARDLRRHPHHLGRGAVQGPACSTSTPPWSASSRRRARCSAPSSRWSSWPAAWAIASRTPRFTGPGVNPWSRDAWSGGSSSGSGSAVAAGLVPVRDRLGDVGLHPLARGQLRRRRAAADLRPRQPARGDGALLDARQAGARSPSPRTTAASCSRPSRAATRRIRPRVRPAVPPRARRRGRPALPLRRARGRHRRLRARGARELRGLARRCCVGSARWRR